MTGPKIIEPRRKKKIWAALDKWPRALTCAQSVEIAFSCACCAATLVFSARLLCFFLFSVYSSFVSLICCNSVASHDKVRPQTVKTRSWGKVKEKRVAGKRLGGHR